MESQSYDRERDVAQIFERFPDFIREYIYRHNWDTLRAGQMAAAQTMAIYGLTFFSSL